MNITSFKSNHKVNACVKNAYRAILLGYAVGNIWRAYKRPNVYKVRAWEWCKACCKEDGGVMLWVTGWNNAKFTCAYFCSHHETGERCIVVHTADHVYWAFVDELD